MHCELNSFFNLWNKYKKRYVDYYYYYFYILKRRWEDYRVINYFKILYFFKCDVAYFYPQLSFALDIYLIKLFAIVIIFTRILFTSSRKIDFVNYRFSLNYLTIVFIFFKLNILFFLYRIILRSTRSLLRVFIFI